MQHDLRARRNAIRDAAEKSAARQNTRDHVAVVTQADVEPDFGPLGSQMHHEGSGLTQFRGRIVMAEYAEFSRDTEIAQRGSRRENRDCDSDPTRPVFPSVEQDRIVSARS